MVYKANSHFFIKAMPLFLAVFIDGAGIGLFFPLLNHLMMSNSSGLIAIHTSMVTRNFLYGAMLSVYTLMWFFGSAILGDLSDNIGRRWVLIFCLFGTFAGYVLSILAIIAHSLSLLFVGRVIDGFTASTQPIAQAALIDMSSPQERTKNIGYGLLASSLGFILGPLIGGVLSSHHVVSWFTIETPFYFAALLSLGNALLIIGFFRQITTTQRRSRIKWYYGISLFISAFQVRSVRYLSFILLLMILGWSSYFSYISVFLFKRYHYSTLQISLFWTVLAIGYAIGFGYLVNKFSRFQSTPVMFISFTLTGLGMLLTVLSHHTLTAWVMSIIIGMANGVGYTVLMSLFSHQVDKTRQGWVMGITGSIVALGCTIITFVGGFLASINVAAPLVIGVIAYVFCITLIGMPKLIEMVTSHDT